MDKYRVTIEFEMFEGIRLMDVIEQVEARMEQFPVGVQVRTVQGVKVIKAEIKGKKNEPST